MAEDDESDRSGEAEMMARLQEEIRKPAGERPSGLHDALAVGAGGRPAGSDGGDGGRRDLGQARLAIDAFKALVEVLERARPAEEMAAHRGVLSQLQLAYVGVLSGGAPRGPGPQPADATAPSRRPASRRPASRAGADGAPSRAPAGVRAEAGRAGAA